MNDYLVQPWDLEEGTGVDLDMWVPPYIDELAQQVMAYYDMEPHTKTLITSKPDKGGAIWKIETNKGPRSLKLLHRKPRRSHFSIGAQEYIVKNGGRVPKIIETKEGALYVEKGGKLWIVTDWIESLTPASKDLSGAQALCYGLGEFHRHTRGYTPPAGSQKASRLYRWPAYYKKIIAKIDWFRNIAKAYSDIPSSQALLAVIDVFQRQAQDALSLLEQPFYTQMLSMGEEHWGLVHQDYGWSNGQLGTGGLWVIDLDGVAYDLPIRDLRKLISGTMDDLGRWDIPWIRGMISAYHDANPIDRETYEIFLNDLAFPNEFYKHLNEMLFDPRDFLSNNLDGIITRLNLLEQTKGIALAELALDKEKFPKGNYETDAPPKLIIKDESLFYPDRKHEEYLKTRTEAEIQRQKDVKKVSLMNKDQLKVLMICTEKLPVPAVRGGAIQTYIDGVSGLLSQEHTLTILGTTDPSLPNEECKNDIRYVRIESEQFFEIYAARVIDFLRDESFDLIHVFNRPRLIPLIREVAPYSRIILSMHNDMFNSDKIDPQDALTAIREVEQIITVSDYVGKTISNLYPQAASKVHTIYSGVDLKRFIPWKKSDRAAQVRHELRSSYNLEDKTVILFVGRLTPKKGTDLLLQAINELSIKNPNIALVIVGGTWYSVDTVTDYVAYVRALAEKAKFPVITTGYVSSDVIHEWFWAGDLFVCPSQWQEPLARVHYEAMAAGLPFLTTARGGNPEVVIDQNGLLVDRPEDPLEFAEKLDILIADPKLRRKMGRTGRLLAEERFSWERVANEVLESWKQRVNNEPDTENMSVFVDLAKVNDEEVTVGDNELETESKFAIVDLAKVNDKEVTVGDNELETESKFAIVDLAKVNDEEVTVGDNERETESKFAFVNLAKVNDEEITISDNESENFFNQTIEACLLISNIPRIMIYPKRVKDDGINSTNSHLWRIIWYLKIIELIVYEKKNAAPLLPYLLRNA
ncbi:spore coat protein, CotS family [Desulfitobacterium dehalogenans ATCC 51507]|uniref:Spore coat protein, CotS family n=1 Tax=Desulfitobacterium dehalogenans (strain ATCC 51507 / DSM 9161 / JW/IU-DC1) TaxID=756499 RepID=I4A850_DESDJ|nr:CotS family spore coat protein [Desulfitobacterium dehalogenans]AFM00135.1 spore coat protein, CotS family [Desulfitobacterium dehalogenans ATCC 51507]